jgi:hypothetical protein
LAAPRRRELAPPVRARELLLEDRGSRSWQSRPEDRDSAGDHAAGRSHGRRSLSQGRGKTITRNLPTQEPFLRFKKKTRSGPGHDVAGRVSVTGHGSEPRQAGGVGTHGTLGGDRGVRKALPISETRTPACLMIVNGPSRLRLSDNSVVHNASRGRAAARFPNEADSSPGRLPKRSQFGRRGNQKRQTQPQMKRMRRMNSKSSLTLILFILPNGGATSSRLVTLMGGVPKRSQWP